MNMDSSSQENPTNMGASEDEKSPANDDPVSMEQKVKDSDFPLSDSQAAEAQSDPTQASSGTGKQTGSDPEASADGAISIKQTKTSNEEYAGDENQEQKEDSDQQPETDEKSQTNKLEVNVVEDPNDENKEIETSQQPATNENLPSSPKPPIQSEELANSTHPGSVTRSTSDAQELSQDPYYMAQQITEEEGSSSTELNRRISHEDASLEPSEYKYDDGTTSVTGVGRTDQTETSTSGESAEAQQEKMRLREQLVEQYRQAVIEHKIARETNLQLQTKLAEYFRRKKADAAEQQSATSSVGGSTADGAVDYEQRYNKYIISLTELRRQYQAMQSSYHKQIEELKSVCAQRQQEVEEAYKEFTNYKYNIGKKALHSRTGRPINPKDLLAMLAAEQKKETIVMGVRLENIKLRNEVAKVEAILKSKEELAEGLHLIDFEQLKIENQTYNEKIEERNEELAKLKKKISSTVQIMSHVKEKLQAVQFDNAKHRQRLGIADAELTFNRDQLTRLKQARDHLRADNIRLRRSCGLLGKSALLFNYEDSVDAVNSKRAALEETKKITSQYKTRTKSLIDKIENVQEKMQNR